MSSCPRVKNFVIDGSERGVQDIISRLKFISNIKEGEIVDVTSMSLMERGWATSAYRTFVARSESRTTTLEFFRQTIGEALDMATTYLSSDNQFFKNIGNLILSALQECKAGIHSHAKTYIKDSNHISKIKTLLEILEVRIKELEIATSPKREEMTSSEKKLSLPLSIPEIEKLLMKRSSHIENCEKVQSSSI